MERTITTPTGYRFLAASMEEALQMEQDYVAGRKPDNAAMKKKAARTILVNIESDSALYGRREVEANAYRGVKVNTAAYADMPEGPAKIYAKRAAEAEALRG